MNYDGLFSRLQVAGFEAWVDQLQLLKQGWFCEQHHGDFLRWSSALQSLPAISQIEMDYSLSAVTIRGQSQNHDALLGALSGLRPWRKGPFQVAEVFIDTEWRSDLKWERVQPHLSDLQGRRVLDVGCGNGYHAWRMLAMEPDLVIGIDPSVLFNMQFQAIQHYAHDPRIFLLPVSIQQMPDNLQWFDTVLSMGVLYHRRSPFDHLLQLKSLLRPGGELCLETLIIEGTNGQVLVPQDRYARMNNVWFLPSVPELEHWLSRCGFRDIRVVDINQTSTEEQRSTAWMPFESLSQCLDTSNHDLTVEGYPAPRRAVILATK